MASKQIHELPDKFYADNLRVPVQPTDGGETGSMALSELRQKIGLLHIPRVEVEVDTEFDPVNNQNKVIVYWSGSPGYWQDLEPEIWLFRYRGRRGAKGRKFTHPVDKDAVTKHAGSKWYGGRAYMLSGTESPFTATLIQRQTEFECPGLPNQKLTLMIDLQSWFKNRELTLTTGSFPLDLNSETTKVVPTNRRGSLNKTRRYSQYFGFRIAVNNPDPNSDGQKLFGPMSSILRACPYQIRHPSAPLIGGIQLDFGRIGN